MQPGSAEWNNFPSKALHDAEFTRPDDIEAVQYYCDGQRGDERPLQGLAAGVQLANECAHIQVWRQLANLRKAHGRTPATRMQQPQGVHHHEKRRELMRHGSADRAYNS